MANEWLQQKRARFREKFGKVDIDYAAVEADLWNTDSQSDQLVVAAQERLYQHYMLYVDSADRISEHRAKANTDFMTMSTGGASLLAFIQAAGVLEEGGGLEIVLIVLILLCLTWMLVLRSYRTLNSAKFLVVGQMENKLSAAPWRAEWKALDDGKNLRKHMPLSAAETWVPLAFIGFYLVLLYQLSEQQPTLFG